VLLQAKRVLSHQIGGDSRHTVFLCAKELMPGDTIDICVRVNPDVDEAKLCLLDARGPGGIKGLREGDVHLTSTHPGDPQTSSPFSGSAATLIP
jgi:hypothetical protein